MPGEAGIELRTGTVTNVRGGSLRFLLTRRGNPVAQMRPGMKKMPNMQRLLGDSVRANSVGDRPALGGSFRIRSQKVLWRIRLGRVGEPSNTSTSASALEASTGTMPPTESHRAWVIFKIWDHSCVQIML